MSKLRDDLLRNLTPDDQELMRRFRKRPLRAYTLKELLPPKSKVAITTITEFILLLRLDALISQGLVMKIISDGEVYYAKAKGRAPQTKVPYRLR